MSATAKKVEQEAPAAPTIQAVPDAAGTKADQAPDKPRRGRRRLVMLAVPLALAAGGGYVWLTGGRYVSTDNAYVHQPIVQVSPDLAGRVAAVEVAENQAVEAGAPLFTLDPEPYRIALDEAEAALASARLGVEQLRAAYHTAQARLTAAEGIRDVRQREFDRQQSLAGRGITSTAALDEATMSVRAAENDVALANEGVTAAAAALGGDPDAETEAFPAVRAAAARLEKAQRDLGKAAVTAPVAGIVSQLGSLNPGQYVTPGAPVASVVQVGQTWIEANFKETQIETLTIGQPVDVEIDAYPGFVFAGKVESLGSATGSQFALIPAQNATGNWVKVVQRLPVRISVSGDAAHPLRAGMSASVSVDTGSSRLDRMGLTQSAHAG